MQSRRLLSLLGCLSLLSMTSCAGLNLERMATDSLCQAYIPLIQQKGDSKIKAPKPVKDRIAANEETYACNCLPKKPAFCAKR